MKTKFLFPILLSISLGVDTAQAQQWTFGPRFDLQISATSSLNSIQIGDYGFGVTSLQGSETRWGGFARYDQRRWYAQAEYTRGAFGVNSYRQTTSIGYYTYGLDARRQDVRVSAGIKPLPWLRLNGGFTCARYNWDESYDGRSYEFFRQRASSEQNPILVEDAQKRLPDYNIGRQIDAGYRRNNTEGSLGVGVDIGGFTVDLTYNRSLTPILDGVIVNGTAYPIRHDYSYTALRFGYRLFPLKAHLLAPRKRNPAYERIKRDIPFYRNEVHLSVGLLGEDIGSAFIYENRYTHYFTRRFGVLGGLNVMRVFETFDNGFIPKHFNSFQAVAGLRVLPLYSRRHTIGLSAGPTLTYETGLSAYSAGTRTLPSGYRYNSINWRADSRRERLALSWQATADYHFALTDRLIAGPWLRILGLDYASAGIQAGYRF